MLFPQIRQTLRLIRVPLTSASGYRHLLREFIVRDVKGRFAGSMAGILWTLIHPLANMAVYLFLFSMVIRLRVTVGETGTDSFAVFFLTGLIPWLIFSEGLSRSVGCLIENANLITKVVFPVELLPASTVLSSFIVNGIGMLLFMIYLLFEGYAHGAWVFLAVIIPMQVLFTWGLAYGLAAACVFMRDIRELLGIVLMIWFYVTPIIYPISMVPKVLRSAMVLNPMCGFMELYRGALLLHQVPWTVVLRLGILSALIYGAGAWFFMRTKPAFGDVL